MEKKSYKLKMKNIKFLLLSLFIFSCSKNEESAIQNENKISKKIIVDSQKIEKKDKSDFIYSKKHKPNFLFSDFDGDGEKDSAIIVKNLKNGKFGLKFHFANGKKEILGAGKDVLKQGFDDFNWIGVFEIAKKGEVYWNNVNDEGEIITEDSIIEKLPKVTLPNNAVLIHQLESCGGGVIYLDKDKFNWIQQE